MTKKLFYKYAAIALLLLHLVVIGFFVFKKSHKKHPHGGPKNIIINRLDFNKEQQAEFQKLIDVHRKKIVDETEKIESTKKALYRTLKNNVQHPEETDSLINQISVAERNIEKLHFAHFVDLKKMCKGDQLQKFNALSEDLVQLFSMGRKPPKHE